MKLLTYLFTLFFVFNAIAVAPYGIKGQTQSGTLYSNVHQFPNNLVTNMGGINALVETGNKNILVNPSFEHAIFSTGWTNSAGAFAEDLVVEIDGLKAAKVTLSAQTLDLSQDSTLYQAQFADGVQGLASVRVKTSVAGLRVCSRQNGVINSNLCVSVQANGKWGLYKVPFTLGGTSNGISINSNGTSVTGDVYVDDAFVGAVDLAATVDQSTLVGGVVISGCQYTTTSTSFADLTNSGACVYTPFGQALAPSTNIPGVRFLTLDAGEYRIEYTGALHALRTGGSGSAVGFRISDGTNVSRENAYIGAATAGDNASSTIPTASWTIKYNSIQTAPTLKIQGYTTNATSSTAAINSSYAIGTVPGVIKVYRVAQGTTYSSINADTDWQSCQFASLAWQGLGTVTNNLQCKRQGSDLLMRGRVDFGTTTASEARIPLPLWNSQQLTIAGLSKVPSLQRTGVAFYSLNAGGEFSFLIESSLNYLGCGYQTASQTGLSRLAGNLCVANGTALSIDGIRIPIEGWENSNIIIGQFNGLESCTNSYECTDTFSAKISSAGVVSAENIDFISGNCTMSTNAAVCTFKPGVFTVTPNCVVATQTGGGGAISGAINPNGTTGFTAVTYNTLGSQVANDRLVVCQKQGVDYIGKTAKAVASDQNLRTPGVINSVICSVSSDTSNVLTKNRGGCVSSTSGTMPRTITFTSNYWVSTPTCWCDASFGSSLGSSCVTDTESSSSVIVRAYNNNALLNTPIDVFCHGERQ